MVNEHYLIQQLIAFLKLFNKKWIKTIYD